MTEYAKQLRKIRDAVANGATRHLEPTRQWSPTFQAPRATGSASRAHSCGTAPVAKFESGHGNYSTVSLSAPANPAAAEEQAMPARDEEPEVAPDLVEIPKDKDETGGKGGTQAEIRLCEAPGTRKQLAGRDGAAIVATIIRKGRALSQLGAASARGPDPPLHEAVAPGGTPVERDTTNGCLPSTTSAAVAWKVVSASAKNWGVDVESLTLTGTVYVEPWPSNPTSAEAQKNTANPVDEGNITRENFQEAIDDMADYNTVGSKGAGPKWHSTAASSAHEWAHWNTDYVVDSVSSVKGGNWPKANHDLDALRQSKAASKTADEARKALAPRVKRRVVQWQSATVKRWNKIPDDPGLAGATGYKAGGAVLAGLIGSVRSYAIGQGWAAPPPAPGPGTVPAPPAPAERP